MSIDYELAGVFPFADAAGEAMRTVAEVLGAPIGTGRIQHGGLVVHPITPDDDERDELRGHLGFDPDLSLVFVPYGDDDQVAQAQRAMLRAVAALGRRRVRGLLFGDYGDDESLILRIDDDGLTLNDTWPGWRGGTDLRAAVPQPYDVRALTFARR
jgi:hypothetical protein